MYKITIDAKMETHNGLKRMWSNPRPHVGRALYRNYKEKLAGYFPKRVKKTLDKAVVNVVYYTKKLQDEDNFYASLKPLLDVMVDLGMIRDDSPEHIELRAKQIPKSPRYEVQIGVRDGA